MKKTSLPQTAIALAVLIGVVLAAVVTTPKQNYRSADEVRELFYDAPVPTQDREPPPGQAAL